MNVNRFKRVTVGNFSMSTRYILKKQQARLPARLMLGCIGPVKEFSPQINPRLLEAISGQRLLGAIEEILPLRDFPEAPESYCKEMGSQDLATIMIILRSSGEYADLHHLKRGSVRVEKMFTDNLRRRTFNINPGVVGTYGLCLASHKNARYRKDSTAYAFGNHFHFAIPFFESSTYYERIMKWDSDKLVPTERVARENRFPEYTEQGRVARFEELVRTLPKSDVSVELLADYYYGETHEAAES